MGLFSNLAAEAREWASERVTLSERLIALALDAARPHLEAEDLEVVRLRTRAAKHGIEVLDLRDFDRTDSYPMKPWGWFNDGISGRNVPKRARPRGRVPWQQWEEIMLHTAAVDFAPHRALGMPVQGAIARDATIVLCHPLDTLQFHCHHYNRRIIGLEISGKGTCTDQQATAAGLWIDFLVATLRANGNKRRLRLGAHCETHWSRQKDCNREPWSKIAPSAIERHDLKTPGLIGPRAFVRGRWRAPVEVPRDWYTPTPGS